MKILLANLASKSEAILSGVKIMLRVAYMINIGMNCNGNIVIMSDWLKVPSE